MKGNANFQSSHVYDYAGTLTVLTWIYVYVCVIPFFFLLNGKMYIQKKGRRLHGHKASKRSPKIFSTDAHSLAKKKEDKRGNNC